MYDILDFYAEEAMIYFRAAKKTEETAHLLYTVL